MLMNYIALTPDVPLRMHFSDHYWVESDIYDPLLQITKRVQRLVMWVDELESQFTGRSFSILSNKLSSHLGPYMANKNYVNHDFIITKTGQGYNTNYIVEVVPREHPGPWE